MNSTNTELAQIIEQTQITRAEIAQYLNVLVEKVDGWLEVDSSKKQDEMPESELHFLKYCLMSDNKRTHLF